MIFLPTYLTISSKAPLKYPPKVSYQSKIYFPRYSHSKIDLGKRTNTTLIIRVQKLNTACSFYPTAHILVPHYNRCLVM